jgi:indolepyruvate ferredoxin oxidoreductase beta subunit
MKKDIILAGVGGQGILSIAAVLDFAALKNNLNVKQAEVHGMSQRGGAVQSHLRLSSETIYSDLIPQGSADLIVSVEFMEPLRYLPHLAHDGWIITSATQVKNIPNYPDPSVLKSMFSSLPHTRIIESETLARNAGSVRAENMVMLGAVSNFVEISSADFEEGIRSLFANKGAKIIDTNLAAFHAGQSAGK